MHCQEKVLHCFPSIVEKIPTILFKQEEPWYNKTIEMARRLDLMSLRYAMALFFESTLFWCLCLLGGEKGQKIQTNQVLKPWTINFSMSALGQGNRPKKDLKVTKQRFCKVRLFVGMYFIGYSTAAWCQTRYFHKYPQRGDGLQQHVNNILLHKTALCRFQQRLC